MQNAYTDRDLDLATATKTSRTILLEGDGSFQATCRELSPVIRHGLDVTIFIVNNVGYAYERHIRGIDADYYDVAPWRYSEACRFFGGVGMATDGDGEYKVSGHMVATWGQLEALLRDEGVWRGRGCRVVDIGVGRDDCILRLKNT